MINREYSKESRIFAINRIKGYGKLMQASAKPSLFEFCPEKIRLWNTVMTRNSNGQ